MKNNAPLDMMSAYSEEDGICYSQEAWEGKKKGNRSNIEKMLIKYH